MEPNGKRVAIVAGLRTPFAKQWSAYREVSALDLANIVVAELLQRVELDPKEIQPLGKATEFYASLTALEGQATASAPLSHHRKGGTAQTVEISVDRADADLETLGQFLGRDSAAPGSKGLGDRKEPVRSTHRI